MYFDKKKTISLNFVLRGPVDIISLVVGAISYAPLAI